MACNIVAPSSDLVVSFSEEASIVSIIGRHPYNISYEFYFDTDVTGYSIGGIAHNSSDAEVTLDTIVSDSSTIPANTHLSGTIDIRSITLNSGATTLKNFVASNGDKEVSIQITYSAGVEGNFYTSELYRFCVKESSTSTNYLPLTVLEEQ